MSEDARSLPPKKHGCYRSLLSFGTAAAPCVANATGVEAVEAKEAICKQLGIRRRITGIRVGVSFPRYSDLRLLAT